VALKLEALSKDSENVCILYSLGGIDRLDPPPTNTPLPTVHSRSPQGWTNFFDLDQLRIYFSFYEPYKYNISYNIYNYCWQQSLGFIGAVTNVL